MKIKNIKCFEYIETFDGSVNGVKLKKDLGEGWGLYFRESDDREFLINDFKGDDEYILNVK